jgi:hypothetical protein
MPTTWFFDAAGTGPESRVLVLSGVGASDATWQPMNSSWRTALATLQLSAWHSTEYFWRRDQQRAELPAALLNVIGQHVNSEFNCISYAIDKRSASAIRQTCPTPMPPDTQILMRLCFAGIGTAAADRDGHNTTRILFDRGEPFIHHLKHSWQRGRKYLRRERADGWPLQVHEIEPASSKDHPGLQVADLISWMMHCRYEYGDKMVDPKIPMLMLPFLTNLRGGYLDHNNLQDLFVHHRSPAMRHTYAFV